MNADLSTWSSLIGAKLLATIFLAFLAVLAVELDTLLEVFAGVEHVLLDTQLVLMWFELLWVHLLLFDDCVWDTADDGLTDKFVKIVPFPDVVRDDIFFIWVLFVVLLCSTMSSKSSSLSKSLMDDIFLMIWCSIYCSSCLQINILCFIIANIILFYVLLLHILLYFILF